ncbi:MAG: hypothetical protein AUG85_05815 [Gemmatimonadetes bacterium 13_1_20CM_4_66_11]|nr:MAG: hypothetical protein AUG85_05815 [Gemmatimonadetes bacterium 13_1_20CM_4_66_11]
MTWWRALIDAGAVAGGGGRTDEAESGATVGADLVEGSELQIHRVADRTGSPIPPAVSFLNGIERWSVVAYDGVVQVVNAYVAAAVRRRDKTGVLHTTFERSRAFAIAPLDRMSPALRQALEQSAADIEAVAGELVEQPARYLEMVEATVRRGRARIERDLAEQAMNDIGPDEWLVIDGLLSRSPDVARHPRALGVIKSHGTQFLEGRGLERALTLPAGHRTSVFAVRGGHTRTEVYSWYLRLWPWEGNDLLYGLLRIEARAHADSVKRASELSRWLWAERAPLATPATRWDRLLYPLHHVEEYLKTRAPRDLQQGPRRASRLPRLAS